MKCLSVRHQRQFHENQKIETKIGYVVFEKATKNISRKDVHQCEYCDFATERIFNLKVHIKRKHEVVKEEKQVKCDKCDYTTTRKCHLVKHMNEVKHKKPVTNGWKMKVLKRLKGELNIVERKFDETHAIAMLEDCKGSVRDIPKY